ncbi:hypothetical protein NECAME_17394 [Necator americanus]|uniref:Uncharacterized protein n=1 Tax=Necator americanus TaxID=51031 RepID=W2TRI8_NECAM|nr:hypothetical protein NECAME_17394 [Necator americanus]ETN83652.1 hypothetical protein NECAME_17394 [Necator americanus]
MTWNKWKRLEEVSTISVYGYFAFALIGRQFPSHNEYREVPIPVELVLNTSYPNPLEACMLNSFGMQIIGVID